MRIDMSNGAIETIPNEKVLASIGDHIDNPIPDPPTPKLAATVMLVRDSKPSQTKYRIDDGRVPARFPEQPERRSVHATSREHRWTSYPMR